MFVRRQGPEPSPTAVPSGTAGSPAAIFLSYAAEDRARVEGIASYLVSRGWSVWWDRHIPVGAAYDEVIDDALRRARCVVVLWTRTSAASRWVRAEASEAARRDILVPVLLEDATIPLEFRVLQALDLREADLSGTHGALGALHDAVERICSRGPTGPDQTQRVAETDLPVGAPSGRGARRRLAALSVAGLLVAGCIAGVWYWDAHHRELAEPYAGVTTRFGLPHGVGPLSSAQVRRRSTRLVLVRRGRRNPAHEVRVVNSAGNTPPVGFALADWTIADLNPVSSRLTRNADDAMDSDAVQLTRVLFTRDAAGRILEQSGFNRGGRRLYTLHFAQPDLGEYKAEGFGTAVRESGIRYLRYTRIPTGPLAGLDERVEYLSDRRERVAAENGEYGVRFSHTDQGWVSAMTYLGADGADRPNRAGVLTEARSYDQTGGVVEATTMGEDGKPQSSRLGPTVVRFQRDEVGNVLTIAFFDHLNQPLVPAAFGAAAARFAYDARGQVTELAFVGPDGRLVRGAHGVARQTIDWQTPTRALLRFFSPGGQPARSHEGAFEVLTSWDSRGYAIESAYRNERGEAVRGRSGCAIDRMRYDGVGNPDDYACLGFHGQPSVSVDGISRAVFTSDAFGNRLTETFFDLRGERGMVGDTYAEVRYTYGVAGTVVSEAYFDAAGRPVRNRAGLASVSHEYDVSGNQVRTVLLDERGNRVDGVQGYAMMLRTFNDRRLPVEVAYRDARGSAVPGPEGAPTVRYDHDERGFLVRLGLSGVGGRPVAGTDGYVAVRFTRNQAGQLLERTHLDDAGRPAIARRLGYASRRWTYDDAGLVVERSDYDHRGRLVVNALGYAAMTFTYDEFGTETGRTALGLDRRPIETTVSVDRVRPGSVASDVGFTPGDLILTYDGRTVSTSVQFTGPLELNGSDRSREVRVERAGAVVILTAPPGRIDGLELVERAVAGPRGEGSRVRPASPIPRV